MDRGTLCCSTLNVKILIQTHQPEPQKSKKTGKIDYLGIVFYQCNKTKLFFQIWIGLINAVQNI